MSPTRPSATSRFAMLLGAVAASALALSSCSSSPQGEGSTTTTSMTTTSTSTTIAGGGAQASVQWSAAGTWGKKPTVVVPSGPPPTQLLTHDLIVGTGATAQAGQAVTVEYVGVSYTTKQQFDASWDRGQPFSFQLGARQVIAGWDEGVAGMKVGGRRELIIPPALAYGATSPGAGIVVDDTLVFIVDLIKVG